MGQTPSADLPPIDDEPEETLPPPHRAVRKQDITSLAVYMYDSEDMKTVDRSGNTPFAYALRLGLDQIALYMIEHFNGIDPNQLIHLPNGESEPVIRYARRMQYSALVVSMFRRGAVLDDTEGALALAVQADNEALVIQLLDNNADPNERALGTTMLHLALRSRSLGIIRALLDRRADVNVYDDALAQPLYRAVELGSLPMTRILLEAAADPNAYAHGPGGSAVHLAAKHAYTGLLCLLIDFGGSRFLSNEHGELPSDVTCSPRIQRLIEVRPTGDSLYQWSIATHPQAPQVIKQAVLTITMIRSLEHSSFVSLLPNELLFQIFEHLEVLPVRMRATRPR